MKISINTGLYTKKSHQIICDALEHHYGIIKIWHLTDGEVTINYNDWCYTSEAGIMPIRKRIARMFKKSVINGHMCKWPTSYDAKYGEFLLVYDFIGKIKTKRLSTVTDDLRKDVIGQPLDPIATELEQELRFHLASLEDEETAKLNQMSNEYRKLVKKEREMFQKKRNQILNSMKFPPKC